MNSSLNRNCNSTITLSSKIQLFRASAKKIERKIDDLTLLIISISLIYSTNRNELKISTVAHLKYASDEDLKQIGLSKPEIRRLRKYYEKYYPHGYLSKIKRLLQNPTNKRDEIGVSASTVFLFSFNFRLKNGSYFVLFCFFFCFHFDIADHEYSIVDRNTENNKFTK